MLLVATNGQPSNSTNNLVKKNENEEINESARAASRATEKRTPFVYWAQNKSHISLRIELREPKVFI
jgi:hypothetical protein